MEAARKYVQDLNNGSIKEPEPDPSTEKVQRDLLKDFPTLWKHGRVPYEISGGFSTDQRAIITAALSEFRAHTCIVFISRMDIASDDKDYLKFKHMKTGYCTSMVGRQGGKQETTLIDSCVVRGTVMHEMMHVLGFEHEHQRTDRDDYVKINLKQVPEGKAI